MIVATSEKLVEKTIKDKNGNIIVAHKVISLTPPLCPQCRMLMKIIGSRQRSYLDDNTNKKILIIRRLKCENCNKIHHELPSFLLPYKRHRVETIQLAIDDPKALIKNKNVGAAIPYVPETTIRKIKLWAEVFLQYAFECVRLRRLRYPVANEPPPPSTPEELRQGANWLAKLVVEVANFFPWKKDAR